MDEPPDWPANAPRGVQLYGPDLDADVAMLVALGSVVRASSQLELALRSLFCGLEASKYAAITAAGQNASWLLEMCDALLKRRADVAEHHHVHLQEILGDATVALQDRNRFVHDVWVGGPGGTLELMRSHRKNHDLSIKAVTLDAVIATSQTLIGCAGAVHQWIFEALGPDAVGLEAQLRWEDYLRASSSEDREA